MAKAECTGSRCRTSENLANSGLDQSRQPDAEFSIPPGNTNDGYRWQVSPDGKRFLFVVPAGENRASPIDVIVNWQSLLEK